MKIYRTGASMNGEYDVNWFQYYVGSWLIKFFAKVFRMNISIGESRYWYGKKPDYSKAEEWIDAMWPKDTDGESS